MTCYLHYFWIGRNWSSGKAIKVSHFFAEALATLMMSDPQVRLWFARTGTLTLYRSPYTVHTRKSLSSTALSQSDNGVQYVDCNPGRGGCPREGAHRWVYGLFVLHSSDAV